MAVITVIFDFDDTLVPDSTSLLFESHGIDPRHVWTVEAKRLTDEGYDPPLAYLRLILDRVGPEKELGELTNAQVREFGASLDDKYFPGLPERFDDLRQIVEQHRDVTVELYVISGGLEEVIAGSSVIQQHFQGYYGCQFGEDEATGLVSYVKRCITFTEKTRYLFEINKGIDPDASKTQPHLVNRFVPREQRRVPFDQMIYVGDGQTDIPCFSAHQRRWRDHVRRVQARSRVSEAGVSALPSDGPREEPPFTQLRAGPYLGALLRAAVATAASKIMLKQEQAGEL